MAAFELFRAFFEHEAYLHARVPRVRCPQCGVRLVAVPWARSGSGFTLLFEALVLQLIPQMPVNAGARLVGETDHRLWRIVHHYVDQARAKVDLSQVRRVGIDETASRRAHNYVSLFVDLEERKVLFATPGRDAETVTAFAADLAAHGGAVTTVCQDMSPAFAAGVADALPNATITFDKFHVIQLLNQAVDAVRRAEQKTRPALKRTRYLWLKNPGQLTAQQQESLAALTLGARHLKTARAYRMRLRFQELYTLPQEAAEPFLKRWYFWATHSRLQPMIDVARTSKRHWQGILTWFTSGLANGLLEGINSLVQAAKARGYRSNRNLIAMIYLIAGKLDIRPIS